MNYQVVVCFNNVKFIEADSKELAEEIATEEFTEEYDLAPGQAYVEEIKEI